MLFIEFLVLFFLVHLTAGRSVVTEDGRPTCRWALPSGGMYTSYWADLLQSGRFRPALEAGGGHHVRRLRHQLLELRSAVEFYQDPFTWAHFGKSFHQTDTELTAVRYYSSIGVYFFWPCFMMNDVSRVE